MLILVQKTYWSALHCYTGIIQKSTLMVMGNIVLFMTKVADFIFTYNVIKLATDLMSR